MLFASAGMAGEAQKLGATTEKNFDALFGLNTRGTFFTVQKALPLFNDGGSIFMTGRSPRSKAGLATVCMQGPRLRFHAFSRGWLNELKDRRIRVNVLSPGQIATPIQEQVFDEATKRQFEALIPRGKMGRPRRLRLWRCFWLPTTRALSMESSWPSTAAPRRSEMPVRERTDDEPLCGQGPTAQGDIQTVTSGQIQVADHTFDERVSRRRSEVTTSAAWT